MNCVKQGGEFGIMRKGMKMAAPITYINDVHGIGLELAAGLLLTETFYWDLNDRTRAFTKRVQSSFKDSKPNPEQAGAYSGVLHYLKASAEIGPAQAKASGRAAVATMKAMPTDDDVFGIGRVREDGQKLHPAYLFEVKAPSESKLSVGLLQAGCDDAARGGVPADEPGRMPDDLQDLRFPMLKTLVWLSAFTAAVACLPAAAEIPGNRITIGVLTDLTRQQRGPPARARSSPRSWRPRMRPRSCPA